MDRRRSNGETVDAETAHDRTNKDSWSSAEASSRFFKGRTVEQALDEACRYYHVSPEQLVYRKVGRRRICLGIFGSECVIEVMPRPSRDRDSNDEQKDGRIGVKDGRVVYVAPDPHGKYPTVTVGEGVVLNVCGEEIVPGESFVIFPDDKISISTKGREPKAALDVAVYDDGMIAEIVITRESGFRYRIEDLDPMTDLVLEAVKEEIPARRLTEHELRKALQDKGIVYGIDEEAIQNVLHNQAEGRFVVARGTNPAQTVDDAIHWLVPCVRGDWRSTDDPYADSLTMVQSGEVIAVYRPGQVGEPGRDVAGHVIEPDKPKRQPFVVGKGVTLRARGNVQEAVATQKGCPSVTDGKITILPIKVIEGDITSRSGAIDFSGDVVVFGNVVEAARIRAEGNIIVRGLVSNAHLAAAGSVIVHRGIVRSEVLAGGCGAVYFKVSDILHDILSDLSHGLRRVLKKRKSAAGAIVEVPNINRHPSFQRLQLRAEELTEAVETSWERDLLHSLHNLSRKLRAQLHQVKTSKRIHLVDLVKLYRSFLHWHEQANRAMEWLGTVIAPFVQNSRISVCGDILLSEAGSYESKLTASRNVMLYGRHAFARRSQIMAGGIVEAEEIGNFSDRQTKIKVPSTGQIWAGKLYAGTEIQIGDQIREFTTTRHSIEARLGSCGNIRVESNREKTPTQRDRWKQAHAGLLSGQRDSFQSGL